MLDSRDLRPRNCLGWRRSRTTTLDLSSCFIPSVIENRSVSRHFYKLVPRIASSAGSVMSNCCSNASSDMQKLDSPMRKLHQSLRSTNNLSELRISPQRPVDHLKMQIAGRRVRICERDGLVEFDAQPGRGRRNHIP